MGVWQNQGDELDDGLRGCVDNFVGKQRLVEVGEGTEGYILWVEVFGQWWCYGKGRWRKVGEAPT